MARLIDKDPLLEAMKKRKEYVGRPSDPVCLVEDAPTVDAVQVVRCKDCKYYYASCDGDQGYCDTTDLVVHADWFCAWGKRRNGGTKDEA